MKKGILFFIIATLAVIWINHIQVDEGTFLQGDITEINEATGDMEIDIEAWQTVTNKGTTADSYGFDQTADSKTIRVSDPENYEEGQTVQAKVIKNYNEKAWDVDRLQFEVDQVD